jgi:hypothetical protein
MRYIVIDPGHGGSRNAGKSSAFGARGTDGTIEPAVNYALAERVQRLLGRGTILTRSAHENRSLAERAAVSRERGAGVFLSLHAHGHSGPSEAWVHNGASQRSLRLAEAVVGRLAARLGGPGPVRRGDLAVLHPRCHAPGTAACMLETNALADGRNLDRLATTIVDGVNHFLDDRRFGHGPTARGLEESGGVKCATWTSESEYRDAVSRVEALFSGSDGSGGDPQSNTPATAESLGLLPSFSALTPAQIATARGIYGSSIDYSNVYITDISGLGGRAFTVYVPFRGIQVINAGTLSPGTSLLIHEMAHVWQSQHATDPKAFMTNSVTSQAMAMARNVAEGSTDPQFPYSSYAYVPGRAFADYAAEQIANQIENGETAIISHVAGVSAGTTDPDNDTSLATARVEDTRTSGVHP